MRRRRLAVPALALLLASRSYAGPAWTSPARWSAAPAPKPGPALVIGSYGAGCLQGAVPLAPEGPGFEVLRLGRRRFYGHPELVDYVSRLAAAAREKGLPALLVGDLSQPRGGPAPGDHTSHQSGLDVDVAYARPAEASSRPLDARERERFEFVPVVDPETHALTASWDPRIVDLLGLAASDPRVDRVFVDPAVKREACAREPGAAWLARLRPWWKHHDHFHVRLACPRGSRGCPAPAPLPPGTGCGGELEWWLGDGARAAYGERKRRRQRAGPPALPVACREILR